MERLTVDVPAEKSDDRFLDRLMEKQFNSSKEKRDRDIQEVSFNCVTYFGSL